MGIKNNETELQQKIIYQTLKGNSTTKENLKLMKKFNNWFVGGTFKYSLTIFPQIFTQYTY